MTTPSEDELFREAARLLAMTPEEKLTLDPERHALMQWLWKRAITDQTVKQNGPATDLLVAGKATEKELRLVIRKAALEALIATLIELDNAGITPGLAESVFHGDRNSMDGWPFNY
jgi:hypothetical protein